MTRRRPGGAAGRPGTVLRLHVQRIAFAALLATLVACASTRERSAPMSAAERDALLAVARFEDGRRFEIAVVESLARHPSAVVRAACMRALSRLQEPEAVELLIEALDDPSEAVRLDAAFALGQTGQPSSLPALLDKLCTGDAPLRAEAAAALGRIGGAADALMTAAAGESAATVRCEIAFALWRDGSEKAVPVLRGLVDDGDSRVHWHAVYALVRMGAKDVADVYAKVLAAPPRDPDGHARAFAARGLADTESPMPATERVTLLIDVLRADREGPEDARDLPLRCEAVGALARLVDGSMRSEVLRCVTALLEAGEEYATVRIQAVDLLGKLASSTSREQARLMLRRLAEHDASRWVKAHASGELLRTAAADEFQQLAAAARVHPSDLLRERAIAMIGTRSPAEAMPWLRSFFADEDLRIRTAVAEALAPFGDEPAARELARRALAVDDLAVRGAAVLSIEQWKDERWTDDLRRAYRESGRFELAEVRAGIVRAMAAFGNDVVDGAFFEVALADPEPIVRRAAAEVVTARTGRDVPREQIEAGAPHTELLGPLPPGPPWRVGFVTSRGEFVVEVLAEAPLQALDLIRRARAGFYDGLRFHRVVPNFVVQGGDPRGDGWGGLDRFVRDQWSRQRFTAYTVGMPTAGKDTGGCQIFVTHCPTPHLDGRYTPFARVVAGRGVIDRIEKGDLILSTWASQGRLGAP